jgi:hypothetical protein
MNRFSYFLFLIFLPFIGFSQPTPKKLLIYYGWPISINATYTVAGAAAVFSNYNYVILGGGLENPSHGDHLNTKNIIAQASVSTVDFYGYIDLGVSTQNLLMSEIQNRLNQWKAMGTQIKGVLFDDFGYDYLVSRDRQNQAVSYAHGIGLRVIANGWQPAQVFGNAVDATYNPLGTATVLNATDFYLSESYLIDTGNFQDPTFWKNKADLLKTYQNTIGFKILSITTNNSANVYDANKFHYAWHGAVLYNHEAMGWGEYDLGASDANVPFRARPNVSLGTSYLSGVQNIGTEYFRFTNLGKNWINTASHTFGFTPTATTCSSIVSVGNWSNANTWDCGRIPLATDDVTVKSGHKITVNTSPTLCRKLLVENGAVLNGNPVFESKANRSN